MPYCLLVYDILVWQKLNYELRFWPVIYHTAWAIKKDIDSGRVNWLKETVRLPECFYRCYSWAVCFRHDAFHTFYINVPLAYSGFLAIIRLSCNWMLGVPCSDLICGWLKMITRLARCNFNHHQLWFLEDSVFVRSMYNFLKVRFYLEVKLLRRWSSGFFSCTFV